MTSLDASDFSSLGGSAGLLGLLLARYWFGLWVRVALQGHHDTAEMQEVLRAITATLVTFSALVLGLLVTSAKTSFDVADIDMTRYGIQIGKVDHLLRQYQQDTLPIRATLARYTSTALAQFLSETALGSDSSLLDAVEDGIRRLKSADEFHRCLQNDSLNRMTELVQRRWHLVADRTAGPAVVLYAVLVLWMGAAFFTFGLTASANCFLTSGMSVCAVAIATAMFVILEMDTPFNGLIAVSDLSLRTALSAGHPGS